MNPRASLIIAAGTIACICLTIGVAIGWGLRKDESLKLEARGQKSQTGYQRIVQSPPGVLPTAGGTSMPVRSVGSMNQARRPATSLPARYASNPAYQPAQNVPEVKQAHEALVAAHKRAADVIEKAMKENYGGISFDAFHKVQDLPQVKQARAAVAEAELKYTAALREATETK